MARMAIGAWRDENPKFWVEASYQLVICYVVYKGTLISFIFRGGRG